MIRELLAGFSGKRVLVLGDVMLDHYVWGRVERISAEAPVPVIDAQTEEYRLGGAANVALNIRSLGAEALLVGVAGQDTPAAQIRLLLEEKGISADHLVISANRPTTLKTRIGAVNQQIVRIDYEDKSDIDPACGAEVLAELAKLLPGSDALIIEDYNKGLLTAEVIRAALRLAAESKVPVAVDPKQRHALEYRGVDIFKPNYRELQSILGQDFSSDADFYAAARKLRGDLGVKNLIVTRGSRGMHIFAGDGEPRALPTCAREVFDVSGAGDTAISAMTLAYICGADIGLAAEVANHAAGVACGIKGTASVTPEQILASYDEQG